MTKKHRRAAAERPPLPFAPEFEERRLDILEESENAYNEDEIEATASPPGDPLLSDDIEPELDELEMFSNYNVDMSETKREGDEMSGDDHSSGLQGGEPELEHERWIDSGMPGSRSEREEEEVDLGESRRVA